MLSDVVVDANVFAHTQDPSEAYFGDACDFVKRLLAKPTLLRVDPGFSTVESKNRSLIGHEYTKHLRHGTLGFTTVASLASSNRIKEASDKVAPAVRKKVNQFIRKKSDRTYLCVAINSDDQKFVSHDFTDFQEAKRTNIARTLAIHVLAAHECCALL